MARPKKETGEKMTTAHIYVPEYLIKRLDVEAEEQRRSRSKEVVVLLEEALELRAYKKQQKGLPFDE